MCVCVCVCACARARARARVCVRACVWYQVIFARVLPVNFIPYSVNVVNISKLVLLKVDF